MSSFCQCISALSLYLNTMCQIFTGFVWLAHRGAHLHQWLKWRVLRAIHPTQITLLLQPIALGNVLGIPHYSTGCHHLSLSISCANTMLIIRIVTLLILEKTSKSLSPKMGSNNEPNLGLTQSLDKYLFHTREHSAFPGQWPKDRRVIYLQDKTLSDILQEMPPVSSLLFLTHQGIKQPTE